MANSLFMVESPPLLDPHSDAKMVTRCLLEPWIWSCSWRGCTLDAITNHVNQEWHVHSMCAKSLKRKKEKQNKQTHWSIVFLKEWWRRKGKGKNMDPPFCTWSMSLIPQKWRGKRKKHMHIKKHTAETKTKQDKIAMNTEIMQFSSKVFIKYWKRQSIQSAWLKIQCRSKLSS